MKFKYKRNPDSRTYANYSIERMELALIGYHYKYKAAKQFKIPYGSIYEKFHGRHVLNIGAPTVSTAAEEDRIVRCVQICGDWRFPLDRDDRRSFVQVLLQSKGEFHKLLISKFSSAEIHFSYHMVLLSGVEVPQFQDNLPGPD